MCLRFHWGRKSKAGEYDMDQWEKERKPPPSVLEGTGTPKHLSASINTLRLGSLVKQYGTGLVHITHREKQQTLSQFSQSMILMLRV